MNDKRIRKKEFAYTTKGSIKESWEVWSDIESIVREAAKTVLPVSHLIERQAELHKAKAAYEIRRRFLIRLFEMYREAEPDGGIRNIVNSLMKIHRDCVIPDEQYSRRHNAVVLRYLVGELLTEKEICKRLSIQQGTLDKQTEKAIEEMMISYFGIEIIDLLT